ncbi:unnamed protein product [Camellia sinensis]
MTRKLAEDCYKHRTENQSAGSPLATAAFQFGASHGSMENERETMLGILGSQGVSEPLRALITGVPLEDACHLTHRYVWVLRNLIIKTSLPLWMSYMLRNLLMIQEKQLNESSSQSVTMQRDADVPPVLDDTISDGPDVPQDEHQNDSYFIAKVIHSFDAQAKGELSLLVDDYVVVRQWLLQDGLKGECQGDAGWFPSAYVER